MGWKRTVEVLGYSVPHPTHINNWRLSWIMFCFLRWHVLSVMGCERTLLPLTETRFKTHAKHSLKKPPTTASLSSFHERQDDTSRAVPCSRPHNYKDRILVDLLHSVFDRLFEDCKKSSWNCGCYVSFAPDRVHMDR